MPSDIMDQRHLSSFYMPSVPSSFFSEEIRFPSERQVGFWKTGSVPDHRGLEAMSFMSQSKAVSSSPLEKLRPVGGNYVDCLELPQPYVFKEQKTNINIEHHLMGPESTASLSTTSWRAPDRDFASRSKLCVQPASSSAETNKAEKNGVHNENGLFSSSLSGKFSNKLRLSSNDVFGQSVDATKSNFGEDEPFESLEEIEAQTIGNLLPDDDDLLSGVIHDLEYVARPNRADDVEDDLFCSGGGIELEAGDNFSCNKASDFVDGRTFNGQGGGLDNPFAGELPCGEYPSRTLFVRSISGNVEDMELRVLFEQYGDMHTLYTACKHRGFVMISYYDIRAAQNAMRALQNKLLRHQKLDIRFFIPKDNLLERDINQDALVVLNLDFSVSNDDLHQIFGIYGEIKEIRETPHKRHHKFIEFYDVRAAEAALCALNRHDIVGKRTNLEPCRSGEASSMQQLSPELEQEESSRCRQENPSNNSPSEGFGLMTLGANTSNGLDNGAIQEINSAFQVPNSSFMETSHGISYSVPHSFSSQVRVATVGNHSNQSGHCELSQSLGQMNFGLQSMPTIHPHPLPEFHDRVISSIPFNSPSTVSAMAMNINSRLAGGIDNRKIHSVGSGGLSSHSFEHNEAAFGVSGNGSCPLHGHQYICNNSDTYHHHPPSSMIWQSFPPFMNIPSQPPQQVHGLPRGPSHMLNPLLSLHHHHVGSAPAVTPSLWDRRHTYAGDCMECMEAVAFHPGSLGSMGFSSCSQLHPLELASHNIFPHAGGNCIDPSFPSAHVGIPSPQQRGHMFRGRNTINSVPASYDASNDRMRSRRSDSSSNQADNKKQYELDIDRIIRGEDYRTTLMIKNIPNKYTSKMLLATIDEQHKGTYDFIYLPIDFKNKCNVGYAFINMIDPQHIIPFYQAFNGKKWEKFNSEKVASLAYARIQGKAALIAHFQNSSLMNEDKRCRPILFHSDGPNAGDQEPFPVGVNIRSRRSRTAAENHQGSPSDSSNGEESSNATDSSGSTKDSE